MVFKRLSPKLLESPVVNITKFMITLYSRMTSILQSMSDKAVENFCALNNLESLI